MTHTNKSSRFLVHGLLVLGLLTISCTRKAAESSSTLVIQFPETKSSEKIVTAATSRSVHGKPNFDFSTIPTSYANVDCLLVFIGGPEDSMKGNYCEKEVDKSNHFKFGAFAGSIAKGQNISLDVPSGEGRAVKIYGMKKPATATSCPEFKSGNNLDALLSGFSAPFFLGEKAGVSLPAGGTTTVEVTLLSTIAPTSFIDHCRGPLLGDSRDGDNGAPNTPDNPGNQGPYLRLEGLYQYGRFDSGAHLSIKPITIGKCLPVSFKTYHNGSSYNVAAPVTLTLPLQTDVEFYLNESSCSSAASRVTAVTIPANSNEQVGTLHMKLTNYTASQYEFNFAVSSSEVGYSSDGTFQIGRPVIRIEIPPILISNYCYPFKLKAYEADAATPYILNASLNLSSTNTLYTSANCTGSTTSANFTSMSSSNQLYLKTPVGSFSDSISISGPAATLSQVTALTATISQGTNADIVPAGLEFEVPNTFEVHRCQKVRIKLMNRNNLNVPLPAGHNMTVVFSLNENMAGYFSPSSDCSGRMTQTLFNGSDYYQDIFFRGHTARSGLIMKANADYLMLKTVSGLINVTLPAGPSLSFSNLPDFGKARYIGSHEFSGAGNTLSIPLNVSGLTTIRCVQEQTGTDCSHLMTGNTFNWSFVDAMSYSRFYFVAENNLGSRRELRFNPSDMYGTNIFKPCDRVLSGTISPSALTNVGGNINCLGGGSTLTLSSSTQVAGLEIIGLSNQSASINTITGNMDYISGSTDYSVLSNVVVGSTAATNTPYMVNINNNSGGIMIDNVNFYYNSSAPSLMGTLKIYDTTQLIHLKNVTINSTPGSYLASLVRVENANNVNINDIEINNNNTSGIGLHLYGGSIRPSRITLLNGYKFWGDGRAIEMYSASAQKSQIDSALRLDITSVSSSQAGIYISGLADLSLRNSIMDKSGSYFMIKVDGANSTVNLEKVVSITNHDHPAIGLFNNPTITNFMDNHFFKKNGSTTIYQPIQVSGGAVINSADSQTNLFCSDSATYQWASGNKVSGSFSGSFNAAINTNVGPTQTFNDRCAFRN